MSNKDKKEKQRWKDIVWLPYLGKMINISITTTLQQVSVVNNNVYYIMKYKLHK